MISKGLSYRFMFEIFELLTVFLNFPIIFLESKAYPFIILFFVCYLDFLVNKKTILQHDA